jgi:hypothetical protein
MTPPSGCELRSPWRPIHPSPTTSGSACRRRSGATRHAVFDVDLAGARIGRRPHHADPCASISIGPDSPSTSLGATPVFRRHPRGGEAERKRRPDAGRRASTNTIGESSARPAKSAACGRAFPRFMDSSDTASDLPWDMEHTLWKLRVSAS